MGKKKRPIIIQQGAAEWMATYSDLVTLLFCFFVLLYASSNPDEAKFQYIFQAFSSGGEYLNVVVADDPTSRRSGDGNSDTPANSDVGEQSGSTGLGRGEDELTDFDDMYNWVSSAITDNQLEDSVSVEASSSSLTIKFANDILFDANSYRLKESGVKAINLLCPGIRSMRDYIQMIIVQGHTAKISGLSEIDDWTLSSARASSVINQMIYMNTADASVFKVEGYGPHKPISDIASDNRRVEVVIMRNKDRPEDTNKILDILQYDYNSEITFVNDKNEEIDANIQEREAVINEILNDLQTKHQGSGSGVGAGNPDLQVGPAVGGDLVTIPDEYKGYLDEEGNPVLPETDVAAEPTDDAAEGEVEDAAVEDAVEDAAEDTAEG